MFNTFNMGTGLVIAVDEKDVDTAVATLKENGEEACVIGAIVKGDAEVEIC